ncbi:MAG TPA: hypothetical protein VK892_07310 [Pyrinomonadaceae bacterium]|nr:hypothetical protein [Pyrinomonadaceae bacterium]
MPRVSDKAVKGDEHKKEMKEKIPGKEKARDRRESSLPPKVSDPDKSDKKSNQDQPKAEKLTRNKRDDEKGKDKPKKTGKEKTSD